MKKLILGLVVLSFGICFAESADFDDGFEDDFSDGNEYEISDGIEDDDTKYPVHGKKSRVVNADEEYDFFDGIEEDDGSENDIDVSNLVYTPQTSGWTIGGYFSALEATPTFSFIVDTFEVELSFGFLFWDLYSDYLSWGINPGISLGYISNPFTGGIQNCVGIAYDWYPMDNTHIGSVYYRFGVRSFWGNGFITEIKMPIVAFLNGSFASIANVDKIPYGLIYSLLTLSVGYKFYF